MSAKSRRKGATGERDWAQFLRDNGIEARRGVQFSGRPDSPDVVSDLAGLHCEVKRTERFDLWGALEQAKRDAAKRPHLMPYVAHRPNRRPWVVVMDAEDWLRLVVEAGRAPKGTATEPGEGH